LTCGAKANLSCDTAPDSPGAIDDGCGLKPGHGAEHASGRAAGHRNQDRLGAGTSPLSAADPGVARSSGFNGCAICPPLPARAIVMACIWPQRAKEMVVLGG
jgi:hypothetical protein